MSFEDDNVRVDRHRLAAALRQGGRAVVTVRSKKTGKHVTLKLTCKRKTDGARQAPPGALVRKVWISRAKREGRVGWDDADAMFVDTREGDPVATVQNARADGPRVRLRSGASQPDAWAVRQLVRWALDPHGRGALDRQADVFMALECAVCGHRLTDPKSIERGIGPECFGKATGSKRARRTGRAQVQLEVPGMGRRGAVAAARATSNANYARSRA